MSQRGTFRLFRSETFAEVAALKKPKQTRGRLLSLREILFGRKIGVSKKVKTGGPTCKARFRSTRRCRSAAGLT